MIQIQKINYIYQFTLNKLPITLQFWNLKLQLKLYLYSQQKEMGQQNGPSAYKRFALTITTIFLASSILATLVNFSPLARLIQSDPCLFFHLPPRMNWIFALFALDNIILYLGMYKKQPNAALVLVRRALYDDNQKEVNSFFAQPYIRNAQNESLKLSLTYVQECTNRYLLTIWYFITFVSK